MSRPLEERGQEGPVKYDLDEEGEFGRIRGCCEGQGEGPPQPCWRTGTWVLEGWLRAGWQELGWAGFLVLVQEAADYPDHCLVGQFLYPAI